MIDVLSQSKRTIYPINSELPSSLNVMSQKFDVRDSCVQVYIYSRSCVTTVLDYESKNFQCHQTWRCCTGESRIPRSDETRCYYSPVVDLMAIVGMVHACFSTCKMLAWMEPTYAETFVLWRGRKEQLDGLVGRIVANCFQNTYVVVQNMSVYFGISAASKYSI